MKLFPLSFLLSILVMTSCGGGSSGGSSSATGSITLSGDDTSAIGTQLHVGRAASVAADGLQPAYVMLVDSAITYVGDQPIPIPLDVDNTFVVIIPDPEVVQGISMTVIVDGNEFDYTCTSFGCGVDSISVDFDAGRVSFDDTTVTNADSNTILTMNGTVTW